MCKKHYNKQCYSYFMISYLYVLTSLTVDSWSFIIKYYITYILFLVCLEYWYKVLFSNDHQMGYRRY